MQHLKLIFLAEGYLSPSEEKPVGVSVASVASYSSNQLFYTVGNFLYLNFFLQGKYVKKVNDKKTFHCQWMKAFKAFMINLYFRISTACNRSEIKCSIFEENFVVFSFLLLLLGNTS